MAAAPDVSAVTIDGPWSHREVSANGIRLHVAELGNGPLILLIHGFPEFWWAWRNQLVGLAEAGYRAVAADLRGYGASDKPPRGYDAYTLTGDIAGLVRALGERDAMLVGHGWGGTLAWTAATLHPRLVRRLAVINSAHPLRLRNTLLRGIRTQLPASRHALLFQTPRFAESVVTKKGSAYLAKLFRLWSGPNWQKSSDYAEAINKYQEAIRIPSAAHSALEYYRWAVRSAIRPDGLRYARAMRQPITAPTLQLHGGLDTCQLPGTAKGSDLFVAGRYEWRLFNQAGHFLPEEAPVAVTEELIRWAKCD